jgi:hypothetical protein
LISAYFAKAIRSVYREEHVPFGTGAYKHEEVAYYVEDRIEINEYDGSPGNPLSQRYPGEPTLEARMDLVFWEGDRKIIFVKGVYGVGKSSFVDYYLRYYGPTLGRKPQDFRQILSVNVDLRSLDGSEGKGLIKQEFFELLHTAVEAACKARGFDIERYQGKAFFDFALDYKSVWWEDLRREAAEQGWTEEKRREKMIARVHHVDADRWFEAVCQFLTGCRQDRDFQYQYFVLVLDNLDQTTASALGLVINTVKKWLGDYSDLFWRVIIPVRPRTLDILLSQIEPYRSSSEFLTLEAPDFETVL